jgi:ubiquinone/menaquinone biosynthesis C-methylase UbiE
MRTFLRFFFYLLYHPFAFTYDLVAATVSLGRWKDWVLSIVPFIEGRRVLEIGHGPGHLQKALLSRKWVAVGLDESAPMGRLARRNLKRYLASTRASSTISNQDIDYTQTSLARGVSQHLPFHDSSFDTVVATFPTEYIYDPATLQEAYRVLLPAGRLVILPGATILGRGLLDRIMALLFRITGQTPPNLAEIIHERSRLPFVNAGFQVETHDLDVRSSRVYILVATKSAH